MAQLAELAEHSLPSVLLLECSSIRDLGKVIFGANVVKLYKSTVKYAAGEAALIHTALVSSVIHAPGGVERACKASKMLAAAGDAICHVPTSRFERVSLPICYYGAPTSKHT